MVEREFPGDLESGQSLKLREDLAEIGARVRQARRKAGLSQHQLAAAVGYSAANPISKLESGRVGSVDIALLGRIATATSVPLEYLTAGILPRDALAKMCRALLQSQARQIALLEQIVERLDRLL